MQRVPKEFEIFGNRILVKGKKNLQDKDGEEVLGLCDVDELTIWINSSVRGAKRWPVFLHETGHMVLGLLGYDDLNDDDVFVDRVGQVVYQILKTVKYHATRKSAPLSSSRPEEGSESD